MPRENRIRFSEIRPEEWKRGQQLGATTAIDHTLLKAGEVSIDDIVAVQERMNREHISKQWNVSEEKAVKMGDTEGACAFALGALEAICETLDREAGFAA